MVGKYIQRYSNDDKKPAKVVFLGLCILLDLVVLAGIIACFSAKKYLDLFIYAGIFVVATVIRIASLFFTYEIIITIEEESVTIIQKYPIKEKTIYNGQISCLKPIKIQEENCRNDKKCIRLCPKSCEGSVYMIELFERKYVIRLDDYTYSLIEVKGDLS